MTSNKGKEVMTHDHQDKEAMTFGNIELQVYTGRQKYSCMREHTLDEVQQCLVDNLWNMTTQNKPRILNALTYYMNKIIQKPLGKAFVCYAVAKGESPGLYKTWIETKYAIGHYKTPLYKGFYEHQKAMEWIREHVISSYTISGDFQKGLTLELRRVPGEPHSDENKESVLSPRPKIGEDFGSRLKTELPPKIFHEGLIRKDVRVELQRENESLKRKIEKLERESHYPKQSDTLYYKARTYLTTNRSTFLSRFPTEIKETIINLTKERFEDNFIVLQGIFTEVIKGWKIPGLTVTYNHIYKFKNDICYTPEEPLCKKIPLEYASCQCSLQTSIKTAVIDTDKFQPITLDGWPDGQITVATLLDYGVLSHMHISCNSIETFFIGRRMQSILNQYMTTRTSCFVKIQSSIPEYIGGTKFQEALHRIRIYPNYRREEFDTPTIPWESKLLIPEQMKHHRTFIYGYAFLEDFPDVTLVSETKNQKIYVHAGAYIFEPPFYMEFSEETEKLADEWSILHEDEEERESINRDSPTRCSDIEGLNSD